VVAVSFEETVVVDDEQPESVSRPASIATRTPTPARRMIIGGS